MAHPYIANPIKRFADGASTVFARRLSENSSVLPAPLMDLLLEVLFDLDSDLGAHRSS